ncbi:MAG: type II toxin-antitoxin system RelB/DinJ family antitoxin [Candidatus Paceibacterota bacterium]|jgi:addiction module RelB/DinJ family antitoxin
MNSTVINIKTDIKIKKEAQLVASDLGLTLSGAINGFLKQLIRNKTFLLTLDESPSKYLLDSIKESISQRKGSNYHTFKNNKDAIEFIKKQ